MVTPEHNAELRILYVKINSVSVWNRVSLTSVPSSPCSRTRVDPISEDYKE